MSKEWNYKPGDWNVICDVCGTKIKASESKRRWDGLIVDKNCFEFRHPQDFLKVRTDKIAVPFVRKSPDDQFVVVNYTNLYVQDLYVQPQDSLAITSDYILEE